MAELGREAGGAVIPKILFASEGLAVGSWAEAVRALRPGLDVVDWRDPVDPEAIGFALLWKRPTTGLGRYPNLRAIQSLGAGVNQLDPATLPAGVPLARLVDPHLTECMVDYAIAAVFRHFRGFDRFERLARARRWAYEAPPTRPDFPVGVMGLGKLGGAVADRLAGLGFPVSGWSRTTREHPRVTCFAGQAGLPAFLRGVRLAVCVLPLTPETEGILNRETLGMLAPGSHLVNMGRGGHLVEPDLVDLIRSGHIAGATLDVFRTEPLPADHPFYDVPEILITPHVAGAPNPRTAAPRIVENFERAMAGLPLLDAVDRERGY